MAPKGSSGRARPCVVARGISTVVGALLFLVVATLILALLLRTFGEAAVALTDVASGLGGRLSVERLDVSVDLPARSAPASSVVLQIRNLGTGETYDPSALDAPGDGRAITATAAGGGAAQPSASAVELITNGDFSNGLSGWSYTGTWDASGGAAYCDLSIAGPGSRSGALWQSFTLGFQPTSVELSFWYNAVYNLERRGSALTLLQLRVEVLSGGTPVWSSTPINLLASPSAFFRQTLPALSPGSYTLRFTASAQGKDVAIDVGIDSVSLRAYQPAPPPASSVTYQLLFQLDLKSAGAGFYGQLLAQANATAFVEVYRGIGSGWEMVGKWVVGPGGWTPLRLEGGWSFLLVAYSSQPFSLSLDYLNATVLDLRPARVRVPNEGTGPVEVYSVWLRNSTHALLNGTRLVLAPGEVRYFTFGTALTRGSLYEARVVTASQVHAARFRVP